MGARLSNWGRWGIDDELGCINFITKEARSHAGRLVRTGKSFSLSLPLDRNGPQPGLRTKAESSARYVADRHRTPGRCPARFR